VYFYFRSVIGNKTVLYIAHSVPKEWDNLTMTVVVLSTGNMTLTLEVKQKMHRCLDRLNLFPSIPTRLFGPRPTWISTHSYYCLSSDRSVTSSKGTSVCTSASCFSFNNKMSAFCPRSLCIHEGWNFNSGNYLFTNDTK